MTQCPCCSTLDYEACCGIYHATHQSPPTPEALMRSRYSAYVLANIEYIKKTMRGKPLTDFNEAKAKSWAESVKWLGLEVISTRNESADRGWVEFIARFLEGTLQQSIHEISEFQRINGQWFYINGKHLNASHMKSSPKKIPRNSVCPCGSNKKFKNCHGKS